MENLTLLEGIGFWSVIMISWGLQHLINYLTRLSASENEPGLLIIVCIVLMFSVIATVFAINLLLNAIL